MTFPARSNFNSAGPDDAWWTTTNGTMTTRCSTSGLTFVRTLQSTLRSTVTTAARSFDGQTYRGTDVTIDGKWGPKTERVLWIALQQQGALAVVRDAVAAEARASHLGIGSIAAGVWLLAHMNIAGSGSAIPPSDAIAPTFSVAPPTPPGWTASDPITCMVTSNIGPDMSGVPAAPPVQTPPAVTPDQTPPAATPDQTVVPSPPPAPPLPSNLPTGVVAQPVAQQGGVPWVFVGVIAAGIILIGGIAITLRGAGTRTPSAVRASVSVSKTPRRRRRRQSRLAA